MIEKTPETIVIDCTSGTIDENAPAEVAAQYIRADVAERWAEERNKEITKLRESNTALLSSNAVFANKLYEVRVENTNLRAELAERDAEIARLRLEYEPDEMTPEELAEWARHQVPAREQPRTDAEWKAADRKKRINDLAARYTGKMAGVYLDKFWTEECGWRSLVLHSRALATEVVEAEE